jgi:hypothetical protein
LIAGPLRLDGNQGPLTRTSSKALRAKEHPCIPALRISARCQSRRQFNPGPFRAQLAHKGRRGSRHEKGLSSLCRTLVRLEVGLVAIERPDGLLVERLVDAGLRVLAWRAPTAVVD